MQSAYLGSAVCVGLLLTLAGCGSDPASGSGSGGAAGSGGAVAGGNANGAGSSAAGAASGGNSAAGSGGMAGGAGSSAGGASTAGAGGAAGGGAGGGTALSCTGRLVCDDFEQGAKVGGRPGAPWKLRESDGSVTLDDTRAVSGKYSVKVSITATTEQSTYRRAFMNLDGAPLLPLSNNRVYGRFMIFTDRIPDSSVHWTIAHGDGPYAATGTTATYNYGGMGNLMANYYRDTMPATDCWQTKDEPFPTGKWQCVAFAFDGPNNEMHFWLGQSEVNELHVLGNQKSDATCTEKGVDGKWYAPTFQNISIGWESYQHDAAGAHDAWIDDVVLDDEPVACP